MKAMDKIIGYSSIKRESGQNSDTLKSREAYDKPATALAKKGFLAMAEIKEIKESCTIAPVAL